MSAIGTFILTYWLQIGFSVIVGALGFCMKGLWKKIKTFSVELRALITAMKASLRNDIIKAHERYLARGYILIWELDNVEELYKEYCLLGGNGVVKGLMEEIRELEKRIK